MRAEDVDLVNELLEAESGLTDWEVEFAESLSRWLESHHDLTKKQRDRAEAVAWKLRQ